MLPFEKFGFSDDFQDLILACFLKKPNDFSSFGDIIQPKFFNGSVPFDVCAEMRDFTKKYGCFPSFITLGNCVYKRFIRRAPDRAKECADYVKKLAGIDVRESGAVRDMVISFARERAVQSAFRVVLDSQHKGEEVPGGIVKLFEEAVSVGTNMDDLGLWLHCDIDMVREKLSDKAYGVPTGFRLLDQLWKRGLGPGWLIVPLAPPKRFKTMFCINLALNITGPTIHGHVFYYACEISQELAFMRALHSITQKDEDFFWENQNMFWAEAKQGVKERGDGRLMFKGFASKQATIADIKAHAKNVIRTLDVKPKAIVIDFAETVRPSNTKVSDWRQQADIYTEARALGQELECPIIMPDRCTAETVDKKVPSLKSFQGSFEKGGIVDAAIGLCATEAEYQQGICRYFVFVNRHGPQYLHYRGRVDPARMTMTIDEEIEYDPEAEEKEKEEASSRRSSSKRSSWRSRTPKTMPDLDAALPAD